MKKKESLGGKVLKKRFLLSSAIFTLLLGFTAISPGKTEAAVKYNYNWPFSTTTTVSLNKQDVIADYEVYRAFAGLGIKYTYKIVANTNTKNASLSVVDVDYYNRFSYFPISVDFYKKGPKSATSYVDYKTTVFGWNGVGLHTDYPHVDGSLSIQSINWKTNKATVKLSGVLRHNGM